MLLRDACARPLYMRSRSQYMYQHANITYACKGAMLAYAPQHNEQDVELRYGQMIKRDYNVSFFLVTNQLLFLFSFKTILFVFDLKLP